MTVPYTFGNATTSIPLSNLDADFATPITLGNTNVYLGNTTTSISNLSLGNVTITSVGSTFPNSYLTNSSATLGNAVVTLGGTTSSVGNLTLTNVTISSIGSTFPNSYLANSSVTINGNSVALGGSTTITANASATLTISTGLSGTSYNGGTAVTIAIDSTVATLTGSQTLTNKTINGSNNTLSNIPNSALTNNTVTVNGTSIALGASGTVTAAAGTLTGTTLNSTVVTSSLTAVGTITTGVWNGTAIGNTYLANSTISGVSLGSNLANLTAGTNITFSSGTTYNGSSAITINATASPQVYPGAGIPNSTGSAWGTSYSTTGTGTVVALATSPTFVTPALGTPSSGTLTNTTGFPAANLAGTALPSAIVTSSLTSVGTIATGTWNGTAIGIGYGGTGQITASAGFNALSPITTTGDLIIGNGTNSATRLPIGTSGYVLTSNGTTATWSSSGSGSGTVNSGTANQLTYYASTGTAVSGYSGITVNGSTATPILNINKTTNNSFSGINFYSATASLTSGIVVNDSTGEFQTYAGNSSSGYFMTWKAGSNTEMMRLTSGGALGIGTTSPSGQFQVNSSGYTNASFSSTGAGYYSQFTMSAYTGGGTLMTSSFITDGGSGVGKIGTGTSHPFVFQTVATEAMRIDTSQNLLVGTTSASGNGERINVTGSSTSFIAAFLNTSTGARRGFYCTYTGSSPPNDSGNEFLYCNDNSALRMTVRSNGGIANYSANNVNLSDETMKKDIQLAGNYLEKLTQIPVKTFLFNDQTDTDLNLGVIAQDVKAVAPELVGTMNIGTDEKPNVKLAIYETDLKYAMLKAIQELNTLVTTQSAEIAALKQKVGI